MLAEVPGKAGASPSAGPGPVLLAARERPAMDGAWDLVLQHFELHLLVSGAAPGTIATRLPSVRHMAAAMTGSGITVPSR